jgi:hypothetical protein
MKKPVSTPYRYLIKQVLLSENKNPYKWHEGTAGKRALVHSHLTATQELVAP